MIWGVSPLFLETPISVSKRHKWWSLPNSSPSFSSLQNFRSIQKFPVQMQQKITHKDPTFGCVLGAKNPTCNSAKVLSQPDDLSSHSPSSAIGWASFQELDPAEPQPYISTVKPIKNNEFSAFEIHPTTPRKNMAFCQAFLLWRSP